MTIQFVHLPGGVTVLPMEKRFGIDCEKNIKKANLSIYESAQSTPPLGGSEGALRLSME
jgi:hypothetical protein